MNGFLQISRRLKQQLSVESDKELADLLGFSGQGFYTRRLRNSFPEKELRALAQQRPDLGIDVEYVLTGRTLAAHTAGAPPHEVKARITHCESGNALVVLESAPFDGLALRPHELERLAGRLAAVARLANWHQERKGRKDERVVLS